MTTILLPCVPHRRSRADEPPADRPPPLYNGDRLTQPEFHRRYEAMPENFRAELIGGIVYVASPLRMPHGTTHIRLGSLLVVYEAGTPGVQAADNATVILGDESEPQPDLHLRLLRECGGRSRVNAEGYLVGPPELVIEFAHSSEAIDLDAKRRDYEQAGVLEYLVLCVREGELRPFGLKAGRALAVGADGVYRSRVFPGLWIGVAAALAGNTARLLDVVRQGMDTPQHAAFVKRLAKRLATAAARPRSGTAARPRRAGGRRKRGG